MKVRISLVGPPPKNLLGAIVIREILGLGLVEAQKALQALPVVVECAGIGTQTRFPEVLPSLRFEEVGEAEDG